MTKITLSIEGMRCVKCEAHMDEAIKNTYKVKKVTSSHVENKTVIITDEEITDESLNKIVSDTGYQLNGIEREHYEKKGLFGKIFG